MLQGILPFQYQEEKRVTGMTALAGLPLYLELAQVAGLLEAIERHLRVRAGGQGWTDRQMVLALVLLNLAGGEAVQDLEVLEQDAGFCAILRQVERYGVRRKERQQLQRRWRKPRRRGVPSASAVFRYLAGFHATEEEAKRQEHQAFIPAPTTGLVGLGKVNRELVGFVQRWAPQRMATLDQDATLVETQKQEALVGYKGYKAYQPFTTYWVEQGLGLHSEFRDGNVPAGHEQLRLLQEALACLPPGVEEVMLRSDTAGYQQELLRYCAEGKHRQYGVIRFAIGADVTMALRQAIREVPQGEWHPLAREVGEERVATGQEWAEVCFVPEWIGRQKGGPEYRYVAIREPLRQEVLPGMEEQLPFPTVVMGGSRRYKVTGIVTNRDLPGAELIGWYRERCGKGEEVHAIMKHDLAGGKLPSGAFGENAAWWGIMLLAFNLHRAMQRLVLGPGWLGKRLKAMRFALITLPGRVVQHARGLLLRLSGGHPIYRVLLEGRQRMRALAQGPPG